VRRRVGRLQPLTLLWLVPLLFASLVAQDAYAVWSGTPYDAAWLARHCPADSIVVMGAAQYDGTPSPAFARRLDGALRLYEAGCAEAVLVTGGRREGDRLSEGEAGAAYLAQRGVPSEALLLESTSRSSVQNLVNASAVLADERPGSASVVIVTDDLHAHRTHVIARRIGLPAHVAPVRATGDRVAYAWREIQALVGYRLGVFR
jgi:uncharacterized SAM-binding protein YcdF (DUF218 family)